MWVFEMDDFVLNAIVVLDVVLNLIMICIIIKSTVCLIRFRNSEYLLPIILGLLGVYMSFDLVFIPWWFA